jgi:beta-mannanase
MRSLGSFALVAVSAVTSALLVLLSYASTLPRETPSIGIYEVKTSSVQDGRLDFSVAFFDWNDSALLPQVREFLTSSRERGRLPLLNLEPFADQVNGRRREDLLADVRSGRYDQRLDAIGRILAAADTPVLLRFGHEMDRTGQYPWSFSDPQKFIELYRHVHRRLGAHASSNVRWVWSPAGSPNADRFWPGHAYVDLIGISIYSSRAWMPDRSLESFSKILSRNLWLQRRFGRPLLVAEAGVSGSAYDQKSWIREAVSSLPRFSDVCGMVYFHAPQPDWMPLSTGHEDWTLKPSALTWFLQQLPLASRPGLSCLEA